MIMAGTKLIGGALGTVAALATPGFQMAGIAAAGTLINGIYEFKESWNSRGEKVLSEYGGEVS